MCMTSLQTGFQWIIEHENNKAFSCRIFEWQTLKILIQNFQECIQKNNSLKSQKCNVNIAYRHMNYATWKDNWQKRNTSQNLCCVSSVDALLRKPILYKNHNSHTRIYAHDISKVIGVQSESITFATKRFSECSHIMIYIDWTTTIYNTIRFVCLDLCKLTDDKKKLHTNQIPIKLRYALNVVKWTKISRSCATMTK